MHPSTLVPIFWISCLRFVSAKGFVIDSFGKLPTTASEFRAWKNTLLTRAASIDNTGRDVIMKWVMEACEEDRDL